MIRNAVSCTSLRDQDKLHTHCGCCSQCLDRRFAIVAARLEAEDPSEMYGTDVLIGKRETERSRTMAVDWTRHALRLSTMELRTFMDVFGQELLRIVSGYPDEPRSYVLRQCLELHRRQANLVVAVLKRSVTENAEALALQTLPGSSLLVLHLGGNAVDGLPPDPRSRDPHLEPRDKYEENVADIVPDALRPLEAAFVQEEGSPVVKIIGLCRVEGRLAELVHVLKVPFDEDRAERRKRAEHRYLQVGRIGSQMTASKDGIAQTVKRCRETVKEAFTEVFGRPPGKHLLIESQKSRGYRLDPDLRIVAPGD